MIQLRGVGFRNKGAELMLHAVVEQARRWDVSVAVTPSTGSYRERALLGLYQTLAPASLGPLAGAAGAILPRGFRKRYGIVTEGEIGAVLDASGFAYSDQWGAGPAETLARLAARWRRRGRPVVLLPQAFGPFRDARTREAFGRAMGEVALVFARDRASLAHLEPFRGRGAAIETAPDFTVGVKARLPEGFEPRPGLVAIIPNRRMVDKSAAASAQQYVDFLAGCAAHVARRGMHPLLVVHDTGLDRELAEAVRRQAGGGAAVVVEPDPRALKGVLGACRLVVASRYHALVGALVQGVPSLATGWSHKYAELFDDFGCPGALVEVAAPPAEVAARLDALLDGPERERTVAGLRRAAADYERRTAAMWARVGAAIGLAAPARAETVALDEGTAVRPVAAGAR
jgi:hypothetical protein